VALQLFDSDTIILATYYYYYYYYYDNGLQQLIACVLRHWICKRSIGPERISVRGKHSRTNENLYSPQYR